ncbi:hypothetical protein N7G274_002123 [Stereocaulon virgatum]|uniref:Ecp2 effector protein domain-containing protein n=1 Tax=Stereocaulon virgatum TaxID=373712 RepID=A0ABR4AKS6_9LECA
MILLIGFSLAVGVFLCNQCAGTRILPHPSNHTPPALNSDPICYSENPVSIIPNAADCYNLIASLPSSPEIGTFHHGGRDDDYRLPHQQHSDSCKVLVDLRGLVLEAKATWDGNMVRGFNIIRDCVEGGPGFGGYAYGGADGRAWIKVSVTGNDMGGGNETVGEAVVATAR